MLSNQSAQNGALVYTPDEKLCSEVIAKNNPQSCVTLMKQVSLVQFPADEANGVVDIYVAQSKLMRLTYSAETLLAQFEASGVVGALREASKAGAKMGEQSFETSLPVVHTGELTVLVSSMFGVSTISIGVLSDIKLAGQNEQQKPYSLEIGQRESAISLTLSAATLTGIVQLDVPAVKLTSPILDQNQNIYEIKIDFPGAAAVFTLENALSRISLADFKMAQDYAYAKIDGQPAVQLFSNTKLEGYLQSKPGQQITLKSGAQFSAQADVFANHMFADNGQIKVTIAAATEVLIDNNKKQGKFMSGSLNLQGTGNFNGQINIKAGECAGEDQNSNEIIAKVVCQ